VNYKFFLSTDCERHIGGVFVWFCILIDGHTTGYIKFLHEVMKPSLDARFEVFVAVKVQIEVFGIKDTTILHGIET